MEVLFLSRDDVEALIDDADLIDALARGFADLSAGRVTAPARNHLPMPGGAFLLGMPGHRDGGDMAVKLVTLFEANAGRGLPAHLAVMALFDAETGACRAFMDGTYVTAVRTAAAAALSVRLLARRDARVLTIVGAGVQGEHHRRLLPLVRDFAEVRVIASAAEGPEEAVRTSDVVALTTNAPQPVVDAGWIAPGTHVTSVGYHPPAGELPPDLLDRASLFVESRERAFEPPPVGCAELQGVDAARSTELGELVAGVRPGRRDDDEITVYKAMGHVMEDIVAAELAVRAATERGVGQTLQL